MSDVAVPYQVEENWVHDSQWIRTRTRLTEWSWLTIQEVARIDLLRTEKYSKTAQEQGS